MVSLLDLVLFDLPASRLADKNLNVSSVPALLPAGLTSVQLLSSIGVSIDRKDCIEPHHDLPFLSRSGEKCL